MVQNQKLGWPVMQIKLTKLSDTIPFGKYKGKTLNEISEFDADYITWLIENTETIKFADKEENDVYNLALDQLNYKIDNYNYPLDYDMGDRD
jgi:hypothetical protein